MIQDVSIPAAFAAGIISFLSPCVLPLVPPYIVYLTGTTAEQVEVSGKGARRAVLLAALMFVLGFSTVFVALGASASFIGSLVRAWSAELAMVAGVVIIIMGLHFLGLTRIGFLMREGRVQVAQPAGLGGAYVMGLAFAFGWTPCLGPVLGAILAVAGSEATVSKGAMLLAVYSLGLGVPFLVAAMAVRPFLAGLKHMRRFLPAIEKGMGALLVLTGIAFMSGWIAHVSYWLIETFPALSTIG